MLFAQTKRAKLNLLIIYPKLYAYKTLTILYAGGVEPRPVKSLTFWFSPINKLTANASQKQNE